MQEGDEDLCLQLLLMELLLSLPWPGHKCWAVNHLSEWASSNLKCEKLLLLKLKLPPLLSHLVLWHYNLPFQQPPLPLHEIIVMNCIFCFVLFSLGLSNCTTTPTLFSCQWSYLGKVETNKQCCKPFNQYICLTHICTLRNPMIPFSTWHDPFNMTYAIVLYMLYLAMIFHFASLFLSPFQGKVLFHTARQYVVIRDVTLVSQKNVFGSSQTHYSEWHSGFFNVHNLHCNARWCNFKSLCCSLTSNNLSHKTKCT